MAAKTTWLSLGVAAVIVVLGMGLWMRQRLGSATHGPVEKLTVAAYAGDLGSLVFLAQEQGYFRDNGLEVEIKEYEAGKLAVDAFLTGEADLATAAEFVVVSHSFTEKNLRILATIAVANTHEVISRKDKGIHKESDLVGKKIGVTRKSSGEFFLGTFLSFNHLKFEDVEVVDLTPSEITEALTMGRIDAALTWEPNIFMIKKRLKENIISFPAQRGQDFYFVLLSKATWIERHPATVDRFLRAMLQAEYYIKNNPTETQKFLAQRFKYEPAYVQYSWNKQEFVVTLPQALLIAMEDEADWRIENHLTTQSQMPNYLDFIYLDGLRRVKPDTISIIH